MSEKRVIELEVKDNTKTLKQQYKDAVNELQRVSAQYGETSAEAIRAAKAAAQLKDQIEFSKDLIKGFNPDAKFDALSRSIGGVLNGFQAYEGALGLIGVESEDLQKTMLKVQSAMALSQGLQGLLEAKDSFKQLGAVASNALKGIRTGLAATGIGLFIVALGTVVAYWDDIKAAVSGVSEEQQKLNEVSKAKFETSKAELENLDAQDNILKLQGKSEREILNLKIAKINTAIELGKIELKNVITTSKAEEEAALKNYKLTKQIVDFILDTALFLPKLMMMPLDMAIKGANKVSEALGFGKLIAFDMGKTMEDMQDKFSGFIAGSIFNVEEVKAEGAKTRKELEKELLDLENQKAGYQNTIKELDKAAAQSTKDARKAELDALIELEIRKAQTDEKILTDLLEKRLALEELKGNQLLIAQQDNAEKIRQAIKDDNSQQLKLETKKITDLKVLSDTKLQGLKGSLNAEVEAEKQAAKHKQAVLEAQAVRARKLEENSQSFRVKSVQQGLEIISSLTELFGKKSEKAAKRAFQIQKAASIASALITTYQNATSAYASQFVPLPDPSSPVRGGIAAGIAVATGLVNVAKIASQKFEGGAPGGGGGAPAGAGGGSTMQAPNFSIIGSSGVNQLAQLQQQPTKAYVVSSEVTSQQALDRNRVQNATL